MNHVIATHKRCRKSFCAELFFGLHLTFLFLLGGPFARGVEPVGQLVWDITQPGKCYSQDIGCVVRGGPANPGWLLFYGAVTDLNGISSWVSPGYSEDIFATWSTTDGITFGQNIGSNAPLTLLTSADYAAVFGQGPGGCPTCTGWHIGDPAVVFGENSGMWYMFFDVQSPQSVNNNTWDPLSVATSSNWNSGWTIQAQITNLPGHGPFAIARIFKDPADGKMIVYYNDTWVQIRAAELIDDGTGTNLVSLNGGNPILPAAVADSLSVYKGADGFYYAIADNFGDGSPAALNTLWQLGPSTSPLVFDWNTRKPFMTAQGWYSHRMWTPSVLGPLESSDNNTRVYFWAAGANGDNCVPDGSTQAGLGWVEGWTISDFENGLDPRGSMGWKSGGLVTGGPDYAWENPPSPAGDDINYWDVFANGDAVDDYADYDLNLTSADCQDWTRFASLRISRFAWSTNGNGAMGIQVFAHDADNTGNNQGYGYQYLGCFQTDGSTDLSLTGMLNRNQVDQIKFRVWESSFGGNVNGSTSMQRTHLYDIKLTGRENLPGAATNPSPASGAANVDINTDLAWTPGTGTGLQKAYFGTTTPPPYYGDLPADQSSFVLGPLNYSTTYYWRIDQQNAQGVTTSQVWSFTTKPEWTELAFDNFESGWGRYTDGGADCVRYTGGVHAHQGSATADIQDNSGTASSFTLTSGINVDAPGYTQLKVEFWYKGVSMETGEDFWLQYYNGSTWQTVGSWVSGTHFTNDTFNSAAVIILESSYMFPSSMKIRFRCDASDDNDDVYIDEVRISAK